MIYNLDDCVEEYDHACNKEVCNGEGWSIFFVGLLKHLWEKL